MSDDNISDDFRWILHHAGYEAVHAEKCDGLAFRITLKYRKYIPIPSENSIKI